jgi:hypothetical protein
MYSLMFFAFAEISGTKKFCPCRTNETEGYYSQAFHHKGLGRI